MKTTKKNIFVLCLSTLFLGVSVFSASAHTKVRKGHLNDAEKMMVVRLYENENMSFASIAACFPQDRWIITPRYIKQVYDSYKRSEDKYSKETYSEEEDNLLIHYVRIYGKKWEKIHRFMKEKSEKSLKFRWWFIRNRSSRGSSLKNGQDNAAVAAKSDPQQNIFDSIMDPFESITEAPGFGRYLWDFLEDDSTSTNSSISRQDDAAVVAKSDPQQNIFDSIMDPFESITEAPEFAKHFWDFWEDDSTSTNYSISKQDNAAVTTKSAQQQDITASIFDPIESINAYILAPFKSITGAQGSGRYLWDFLEDDYI